MKIPRGQYFDLSAYEVLRGMVVLFGVQEVLSMFIEIVGKPLREIDTLSVAHMLPPSFSTSCENSTLDFQTDL